MTVPMVMVKICCPAALFPVVVGVVGVIFWYLGEAGSQAVSLKVVLTLRTWH